MDFFGSNFLIWLTHNFTIKVLHSASDFAKSHLPKEKKNNFEAVLWACILLCDFEMFGFWYWESNDNIALKQIEIGSRHAYIQTNKTDKLDRQIVELEIVSGPDFHRPI